VTKPPDKPRDPLRELRLARRRLEKAAQDVLRLSLELADNRQLSTGSREETAVAAASKHAWLIEDLRRSGCSAPVLRHYLAHAVELVAVPKHPRALFVEVCAQLAQYPERVLKMAAERTVSTRSKIATLKQVLDDVAAVLPRAQIRLTPDSPGWKHWLAHLRTAGDRTRATFLENQGVMFQLSEYPPGHWQSQPNGANAEHARGAAA
jgi:hypothetical protein